MSYLKRSLILIVILLISGCKGKVGFVWASVGVMGLDIMLIPIAYIFGSDVKYIDGAIVIKGGTLGDTLPTMMLSGQGITLGNAIFLTDSANEATLYHELQHIKQYRYWWGPAFLPAYVVDYVAQTIKYGWGTNAAYCHIWFEEEAYKAEEQKFPPPPGETYSEAYDCTY